MLTGKDNVNIAVSRCHRLGIVIVIIAAGKNFGGVPGTTIISNIGYVAIATGIISKICYV